MRYLSLPPALVARWLSRMALPCFDGSALITVRAQVDAGSAQLQGKKDIHGGPSPCTQGMQGTAPEAAVAAAAVADAAVGAVAAE